MATLPILFFFSVTGPTDPPGWHGIFRNGAANSTCQAIASGNLTGWGSSVVVAETLTTPDPPPLPPSFFTDGYFFEGEITYSDADDTPLSYALHYSYSGGGAAPTWATGTAARARVVNATYEIALSGSNFIFTARWGGEAVEIDSTPYRGDFGEAQVKIGSDVYDLVVTRTLDFTTSLSSVVRHDSTTHDIDHRLYSYEGVVTVPISQSAISVRIGDGTDWLAWLPQHFAPLADLALTQDDGTITADGSGTVFLGDTPGNFSFASSRFTTVTQAGDTLIEDLSDLDDGTSVSVTLTARTAFTCQDTDSASVTLEISNNIGTAFSLGGSLHSAVKVGSDVQAYQFKDSVAGRIARGAITGAKNPSLWRHDALFYCAASLVSGGEYHVWRSKDTCRTWEQITVDTIWNPAQYTRAHSCGLVGGGAASIANKLSTSPIEIYFRRSGDGIAWTATAILIGTYSGDAKNFHVRQKTEAGKSSLIVSNGADAAWESTDIGRTWTAL